jgi:signal transduction histidine kinase
MNIFADKQVKNFFVVLSAIIIMTIGLMQLITYYNAVQHTNERLLHDYQIAGYLVQQHPEMSLDIQKAFTIEKLPVHAEAGKALMEFTGYSAGVKLALLPDMNRIYRENSRALLALSALSGLFILFFIGRQMVRQDQKLNQYSTDILKILNGEYTLKLDDQQEGSMSKLAAAVNNVTSSLHAHIESEKKSKILLKDNLLNISHQLKTPISALSLYNEIMQGEDVDNEVIRDFLQKSENELERMQVLTANLLKLARLDAGVIELKRENHSLGELIQAVGESFKARLDKERKTFTFHYEKDVLYSCDSEWLFEALSNLVKNAAEHTDSGDQITVSLDMTPLFVRIAIKDNGHGIHPEDLPFVFQRFYRSKYSQATQGTGIGLTLAKAVIEMHGGLIDVESAPESGTIFSIRLPLLQNCKEEFTSK